MKKRDIALLTLVFITIFMVSSATAQTQSAEKRMEGFGLPPKDAIPGPPSETLPEDLKPLCKRFDGVWRPDRAGGSRVDCALIAEKVDRDTMEALYWTGETMGKSAYWYRVKASIKKEGGNIIVSIPSKYDSRRTYDFKLTRKGTLISDAVFGSDYRMSAELKPVP